MRMRCPRVMDDGKVEFVVEILDGRKVVPMWVDEEHSAEDIKEFWEHAADIEKKFEEGWYWYERDAKEYVKV